MGFREAAYSLYFEIVVVQVVYPCTAKLETMSLPQFTSLQDPRNVHDLKSSHVVKLPPSDFCDRVHRLSAKLLTPEPFVQVILFFSSLKLIVRLPEMF